MEKLTYVNLGCGRRAHPDWINIDIASDEPSVILHDLSKGIPLPDESCDVVYHSNLIEHLERPDAQTFMKECFRVLRPGGFIRVGTPDFEELCRLYLRFLEEGRNGVSGAEFRYNWILLEMFDQMVRHVSGGEIACVLNQNTIPDCEFVLSRIGEEGRELLMSTETKTSSSQPTSCRLGARVFEAIRWRCVVAAERLHKMLLRLLLGGEGMAALKVGRFRVSGQIHYWLYDRYSLGRLLIDAGFADPVAKPAGASEIAGWGEFGLETLPEGKPVKPDSFFMEAFKPG